MNENKPILVGGIGEINFGKQYRQGNRVYDSDDIAMCLTANPLGNTGGYSYLYSINKNNLNNKGEYEMKEFKNETLEKLTFNMPNNMKEIRLFDSFAGIGALHNSLQFLGIPTKIIGLSETDVDAIISYASIHISNFKDLDFEYPSEEEMRQWLINRNIGWNFEKQKSAIPRLKKDKLYKVYKASVLLNNLGDISKINYNEIEDFDLFNLSFACTDISGAGKQKGFKNEDGTPTRSGLVKYGIKLIKTKRPKYIMIENVKALIQKKFINDFYDICNEIESYGYKIYYPTKEDKKGNKVPMCLNAKNYAIPQNRERIFVICVRNDCDDNIEQFWEGKDFGYRLKDFLENTVDEKYYLSQQIQDRFKRNEVEDTEHNNLNVVGTSDPNKKIGQRDITYGTNGIMSTLTATDYKQPKQILDNKEYSFKLDGNNFNQRKVVNLSEGIVRTISGQGHCGNEPKTCVPFTNNYGEIKEREDGLCTCLDTRYSNFPDNHNQRTGIIERNVIDEKYYLDKPWHFSDEKDEKHDTNEIAQIDNIKYKATRSISDPNLLCRTLDTMSGGQREPKIIEEKYFIDKMDRKQVYKETENYIQWDTSGKNYNGQNDRAYYDDKNINTICAINPQDKSKIFNKDDFRIRKLTPKECWRLMGFTDEQFNRAKESGISDSQLYKQAGNSIVVNCLYYIFKELFKNYIVK